MTEPTFPTGALIEKRVLRPAKTGLFGLGSKGPEYPTVGPGNQILLEITDSKGLVSYQDVSSEAGKSGSGHGPANVYLVNRAKWSGLPLFFGGIHTDSKGHGWDLLVCVRVRIADGAKLLGNGLLTEIDENHPVTDVSIGPWLQERVVAHLMDRLSGRTYEQLSSPAEMPLPAWNSVLGTVLEPFGMRVEMSLFPTWSSRSAEAAEAEQRAKASEARANQAKTDAELARASREELERFHEAQRQIERAELEAQQHRERIQGEHRKEEGEQLRARHEENQRARERRLAELESDIARLKQAAELAAMEHRVALADAARLEEESKARLHGILRQSELDALLHRAKTLEVGEVSGISTEIAKAKLELELVTLRGQIEAKKREIEEAIAESRRKAEMAEALHEKLMAELQAAQKKAEKQAAPTPAAQTDAGAHILVKDALNGRRSVADAMSEAERLGIQHGFLKAATEAAPTSTNRIRSVDLFTARIRFQNQGAAQPFTIIKKSGALRRSLTRSLVGGDGDSPQLPYETLITRIKDPIGFEMRSPLDGYVTLINPATSGHFMLLTPNARAGAVQASNGEWMTAPGKLVPLTGKSSFGEQMGPAGHTEHLVALVTPVPLISQAEFEAPDDPETLERWDPVKGAPMTDFRLMSFGIVRRIEESLASLKPGSWAAGTISYEVVQ
jgi:hypothetical protein